MDLSKLLDKFHENKITKINHKKEYPAISPTHPALTQAGKTVLITGGGTGVGYQIALAFLRASANTIILVSRRKEILDAAAADLEKESTSLGKATKVKTFSLDISNNEAIDAFWDKIEKEGLVVDNFVSNAAGGMQPGSILELGQSEVWSHFEVTLKGPLRMTERFLKTTPGRPKVVLNVTSQVAHMWADAGATARPAYNLMKLTSASMFQLIAQDFKVEDAQIINFHPGLIYNDAWKGMGLPADIFPNTDLCGAFAVWLSSSEAAFLHGRFVWAAWDVAELSTGDLRKRIDEDPYFLKATINGLN